MVFIKYLLPALAASQLAFADDSCKDVKLESSGDAGKLSSCSTISGDLTINEAFSGDLNLDGVKKIEGGLIADKADNVTSITAPSLTSIGKTFELNGLTKVTLLKFPELTSVGSIKWEALPKLQSLSFDKGVTKAGDVLITNTGLNNLDGITLKTVQKFEITDNTDLRKININNMQNASNVINFAGNYDGLEIDLPNLGTGTNITCRNISSISVPSLEKLTGQLGFWGTKFRTFSAPNLTHTGDLVFNDNSKLSNISMPQLKKVDGGFTIARDDKLTSVSLGKLERITGALDFSGSFDEVSLSGLKSVDGGFNLQSSHGKFSCQKFDALKDDRQIKGKYTCDASADHPTTSSGKSGTNGGSGSSGSDNSSNAAVANGANVPVVGIAAVFYALAQLL
ncbi:hypothetical protein NUU61_009813 [Penicillium alfredii]|uniref:GPI-anchored cell wall organization protein Ecm33 n=1 Tax=Penicillium alfredii TaxID=1506179 RepID=A0A9W9EGW2_9EURO|nr:uncharacterized protein NUU61_009813 [Penicillium alfredii]KAJ5081549.1 hypothetical protein NUU61_009813 [Penicillium alfredii]